MRIRNHVGESGRAVLEYVAETDEDREEVARMMGDGEIPDAPAQREPEDHAEAGEEGEP